MKFEELLKIRFEIQQSIEWCGITPEAEREWQAFNEKLRKDYVPGITDQSREVPLDIIEAFNPLNEIYQKHRERYARFLD